MEDHKFSIGCTGIMTILLIGMILFSLSYQFHWLKPKLKPGQVWVNSYQLDNPFSGGHLSVDTIIKVQGDYVLYKSGSFMKSDTKNWFYDVHEELIHNPD